MTAIDYNSLAKKIVDGNVKAITFAFYNADIDKLREALKNNYIDYSDYYVEGQPFVPGWNAPEDGYSDGQSYMDFIIDKIDEYDYLPQHLYEFILELIKD